MQTGTKPLLLGRFAWMVLLVSASVILTGRYACATAYAWGAVIALSAYGAFFFARQAAVLFARKSTIAILLAAIAAAFFGYELLLYVAAFLLPGGDEAFALPIVLRIALLNIGTFGLLLAGHGLAVAGGLLCRNIAESRAAGMPVSPVR
jgi:hypothetical protein